MKLRYKKNFLNLGFWAVFTSKKDIVINLFKYRFLIGL